MIIKSYSITSGKDATPTTIKIDPVTKNWIVNDNDLGICAEGKRKVLMANRALQDLRVVKEKTDMHLKFQKMDSGWFGMLKLKNL